MKLFSLLALLANQQTANGQNPVSGSVGQTTDGQMRFRLQELRLVNSLANAIKKCQCNENGVKPIDLNRYNRTYEVFKNMDIAYPGFLKILCFLHETISHKKLRLKVSYIDMTSL